MFCAYGDLSKRAYGNCQLSKSNSTRASIGLDYRLVKNSHNITTQTRQWLGNLKMLETLWQMPSGSPLASDDYPRQDHDCGSLAESRAGDLPVFDMEASKRCSALPEHPRRLYKKGSGGLLHFQQQRISIQALEEGLGLCVHGTTRRCLEMDEARQPFRGLPDRGHSKKPGRQLLVFFCS
jgi:hypothetical protein